MNIHLNYIIWLLVSVVFFAAGEFFSKKFGLNHKGSLVVLILLAYGLSEIFWLPAIVANDTLSVVGTMWSVMSLLATVVIGTVIFREKLNGYEVAGIVTAFISIILLSKAG